MDTKRLCHDCLKTKNISEFDEGTWRCKTCTQRLEVPILQPVDAWKDYAHSLPEYISVREYPYSNLSNITPVDRAEVRVISNFETIPHSTTKLYVEGNGTLPASEGYVRHTDGSVGKQLRRCLSCKKDLSRSSFPKDEWNCFNCKSEHLVTSNPASPIAHIPETPNKEIYTPPPKTSIKIPALATEYTRPKEPERDCPSTVNVIKPMSPDPSNEYNNLPNSPRDDWAKEEDTNYISSTKIQPKDGPNPNEPSEIELEQTYKCLFDTHQDPSLDSEIHKLIRANNLTELRNTFKSTSTVPGLLPPLFLAAQLGYGDIVDFLIESKVDVNQTTTNEVLNGTTALWIASQRGYLEIIQKLIKNGADPNKFCESRMLPRASPLWIASFGGHLNVVKYFVEQLKIPIESPTITGATTLFAAVMGRHEDTVQYLLARKSNPNISVQDGAVPGASPLLVAAAQNSANLVKLLLESGANCELASNNGLTPLYIASESGHSTIVKILIEAGADLNTVTKQGLYPLLVAIANGHMDVVQMLSSSGAIHLNVPSEYFKPPTRTS